MHILAYLILCAAVGFMGRHRALGPWGFFLLSVVVTPVIGVLVIALGAPSPTAPKSNKKK